MQNQPTISRFIVAGVVQKDQKIILGKKAHGRAPYPNVWHTPGGGVRDFERAKALFRARDFNNPYFHRELQRELKEELGIEISNISCIIPELLPKPTETHTHNKHGELTHYYFLEYLCDYAGGTLQAASDIVDAKWFAKTELQNLELTPPSQKMYRALGWIN